MNKYLQTVITIPLTTPFKDWPTRVNITVGRKERQVTVSLGFYWFYLFFFSLILPLMFSISTKSCGRADFNFV